mgnify:CR=1 FL=1
MKNTRHLTAALALGAVSALALAGCASGNQAEGGSGDGGDKGTITLGFLPSWTDGLSTAYLLEDQLEKLGYTVNGATLDYHVANHRTLLVILEGTMVFETGDGVQHRVPQPEHQHSTTPIR